MSSAISELNGKEMMGLIRSLHKGFIYGGFAGLRLGSKT
ncbi:hypothetical protein NC652_029310 [Populus alba x Populus x berolinensis]|nr:hypothetical protein NC652_029310 [Populus alba x Populus x berolinensis]